MIITPELVEQWALAAPNDPEELAHYIAQRAADQGAAQRDAELMGVGIEPDCYDATEDAYCYSIELVWRLVVAAQLHGAEEREEELLAEDGEMQCEIRRMREALQGLLLPLVELPDPDLEDHPYEVWGQNAKGNFYSEKSVKRLIAGALHHGAEDERKNYASEANQLALQSLYEFQEATRCDTAAQFVQGERVNQGLLEALRGIADFNFDKLNGPTGDYYHGLKETMSKALAAIAAAEQEVGK